MAWKQLEYSRSQVINAGKTIRDDCCSEDANRQAMLIIDNWRAAHAYPMHVIYMHLRTLSKSIPDAVVAERLKRLDSIIAKLDRFRTMNLWTMQDLGGCRVIVPTMRQLYKVASDYEHSRKFHIKKREDDYLVHPKDNGYRSLHQVYQYNSKTNDVYNNILIEIQFRTRLQHIWATAVETLGLITNQSIKSGKCDPDTERFFALVSSLFAIEERSPAVPNTTDNVEETIKEIRELNKKGHYLDRLRAINQAAKYIKPKSVEDIGFVILNITLLDRKLTIYFFKSNERDKALNMYQLIESKRFRERTDSVLVRTSSIRALKLAYPNYFMDNSSFLEKVDNYLMPKVRIDFSNQ